MLTKMFLFESRFINADNGGPFETLQSATFGGPLGITDSRLLIRSVVRMLTKMSLFESRLLMLTMVVLLRRCNPQRLAVRVVILKSQKVAIRNVWRWGL